VLTDTRISSCVRILVLSLQKYFNDPNSGYCCLTLDLYFSFLLWFVPGETQSIISSPGFSHSANAEHKSADVPDELASA
jgi:hypothetical protein